MPLTLHYDFTDANSGLAAQDSLGPTLGITRASNATMVDADGYIRNVYSGEPRFEGATWSEQLVDNDFDSWTTNEASITDAGDDPPFAGVTAYRFAGTTANDVHYAREPGVFTFPNNAEGKSKTSTLYVKEGTARYIGIVRRAYAGTPTRIDVFDTGDGSLTDPGGTTALTSVDAGAGWWKIGVTHSLVYPSNGDFYIAIGTGPDAADFEGVGTTDYVLVAAPHAFSDSVNPTTFREYIAPSGDRQSSLSGTADGLLVEEARTNLLLRSEDLTTTWGTANSTITANAGTAPDGSNTADDVIHLDTSESINQGGTVTADTDYTYSHFVKQGVTGSHQWVLLQYSSSGGNGFRAWFDISNGVEGTSTAIGTGSLTATGIEDYGNGWYRIWGAGQIAPTVTAGTVFLQNSDGDNSLGEETASSVLWWGAQLEAGAFPTSYIPTEGSSVTRAADDISSSDVTWFDGSQGTFYADFETQVPQSAIAGPISVDNGTTGNRYYIDIFGNETRFAIVNSGGNNASVFTSDNRWDAPQREQVAAAYAQDDVVLYVEETLIGTDTSIDVPISSAPNSVKVGQNGTSLSFFNGEIKEIRWYDERLDDDVVEALSNGEFPTFGMEVGDESWYAWRRRKRRGRIFGEGTRRTIPS